MAIAKLADYDYIFVLTYGRSGSTLLMRLLNSDPHTEIRGENSNALFHLYKSIAAVRRSSDRFGTVGRDTSDPWFGADAMAPKSFESLCLEAFVGDVLAPSPSMKTLGFKEINHLPNRMKDKDFYGYVEFILERFPKSRIVFNTRNAQQVARSGWFADMDTDYVVAQIEEADARFLEAARRHKRCRVIDYKDVTGDADALLKLFAWLGINIDRQQIETCLDRKLSHMSKKQGTLQRTVREQMRGAFSRLRKSR